MIAYASYLPRKSQIVKDAISISVLNCIFSVFAALGVFAVLGYMAHIAHKPISEVVTQALGLAFVAYPKAISSIPNYASFFGIVFFGMLVIAGLSSSISIIEAFAAAVIDKFGYKRKLVVSVIAICGFLGSIVFTTQAGLVILDIVDHFLTQYGLVIAALLEALIIGWSYRAQRLRAHINSISTLKLPSLWDWFVKVIVPAILGVILIKALIKEFSRPYEGYDPLALVLIGRDWLYFTLFAAVLVATRKWPQKEKKNA
jgi:NSS family neurotransmitter:Na+ symporter